MFELSQHINDNILVGVYRSGKTHLHWILSSKLYNVRSRSDLFTKRCGSTAICKTPDFILIYDSRSLGSIRIFKCLGAVERTQNEMEQLNYPEPQGSYITYLLGEDYEVPAIKMSAFVQSRSTEKKKNLSPILLKGRDLIPFLDNTPVEKPLAFIDLFAGLGGFHLAINKAGKELGLKTECKFASELKSDLRLLYSENYGLPMSRINPDITLLDSEETIHSVVPPHDLLCGGFPCQPFSKAGKRQGFDDEDGRGILFNYIDAIVKVHHPKYVFLENVANLKTHDGGNTWKVIKEKLEKRGYSVWASILSPHQFGFPQHRSRIYIVAIDKLSCHLDEFPFPKPVKSVSCSIKDIIETNPSSIEPLPPQYVQKLKVWQEFLDECAARNVKVPHPVWAMEFGATYPYIETAPAYCSLDDLRNSLGQFGCKVTGNTIEECLSQLPNYAQTSKDRTFPEWKIRYIRNNRQFYEENKTWVDKWMKKIQTWENSFIKLEWNCLESQNHSIEDKIVQFRPSGIRVKMPTFSPALTFVGSQVPIFPWITFTLPDGTPGKGRYMTVKEAAAVQGMSSLSFDSLSTGRAYEALGNAVDVDLVKLILKNLLTL